MATSTTTLLQLTNLVLDRISERRVTAITDNRNAERVRNAIKEAHDELQREGKWTWLYKSAVASSWSAATATVSDCGILEQVVHGNDTVGYRSIPKLKRRGRSVIPNTSYTTDSEIPTYFVQLDDNQFLFNPYPGDTDRQNLITFEYFRILTFPSTDSAVFEIPDRFINVLNYNASAKVAIDIMQRPDMAQTFKVEYERLLGKHRRTELQSDSSDNMFHVNKRLENPYIR